MGYDFSYEVDRLQKEIDGLRDIIARARKFHIDGKHDQVGALLVAAYHGFTPPSSLGVT